MSDYNDRATSYTQALATLQAILADRDTTRQEAVLVAFASVLNYRLAELSDQLESLLQR